MGVGSGLCPCATFWELEKAKGLSLERKTRSQCCFRFRAAMSASLIFISRIALLLRRSSSRSIFPYTIFNSSLTVHPTSGLALSSKISASTGNRVVGTIIGKSR